MRKIPYQQAKFLLSVAQLAQLPTDEGAEVAIVGRSNAGKSSVLNTLTQNKNLARVSNTPGRTQFINIFTLDHDHRLADLPGFGYAKVPLALKANWETLLGKYLQTRKSLRGIILVMDARHPFQDFDKKFITFASHYQLPIHILLNKVDKLSFSESKTLLHKMQRCLACTQYVITFQLFSALKKTGLCELRTQLDTWFNQ